MRWLLTLSKTVNTDAASEKLKAVIKSLEMIEQDDDKRVVDRLHFELRELAAREQISLIGWGSGCTHRPFRSASLTQRLLTTEASHEVVEKRESAALPNSPSSF